MNDIASTRRRNLKNWVSGPSQLHDQLGGRYSFWRDLLNDPEKSFGEKVARRIESQFSWPEGCLDQADAPGDAPVAHALSPQPFTVPTLTREELMQTEDLPDEFWLTLWDDAMAPRAPKGTVVLFKKVVDPAWGDAVLAQAPDGSFHVRLFAQDLQHGFQLVAANSAFARFHGDMPGVRVLASMRAIRTTWSQFAQ